MSIYYKYAPDEKYFVLSYVTDCVYCYTSEAFGIVYVGSLGNILHEKFLGYAQWFMLIRIYQIKDHSISFISG